ncbi:MAG: rod shape-determining protein MreD [Gammaproteobacteria bacterium]
MAGSTPQGGGVIIVTFVVALMLTAFALPSWAELWRPAWVALVLVYWCMALPHRIGIGTAWGVGIVLDALMGTLLGQHALALCVVAFITLKLYQRIRILPIWQQGISVFALILLYQLCLLWVHGSVGRSVYPWSYWSSPLTSTLLWPSVFVLLRSVRRRYRVA